MNRRQIEALESLGIEREKYYVDAPEIDWDAPEEVFEKTHLERRARGIAVAPIWGLALRIDGRDVAVVEQTPRAHDYEQDGRYHLRRIRSRSGMERSPSIGSFKTQREAIAGAAHMGMLG